MLASDNMSQACQGHCIILRDDTDDDRRVLLTLLLVCLTRSCSICTKKQNLHFIVPEAKFELTKVGKEFIKDGR